MKTFNFNSNLNNFLNPNYGFINNNFHNLVRITKAIFGEELISICMKLVKYIKKEL